MNITENSSYQHSEGNNSFKYSSETLQSDRSERVVLLFIAATNVPCAELASNAEPSLRVFLNEASDIAMNESKAVFAVQSTPPRQNTKTIIWNSYRVFHRAQPNSNQHITIQFCDIFCEDGYEADCFASVSVPIDETFADEQLKIFPFEMKKGGSNGANPKGPNKFSIIVRRCFLHNQIPTKKTFFLVRHGESKWNSAQKAGSFQGLLDFDHALTKRGIEQSLELNKIWSDFMDADADETDRCPEIDALPSHAASREATTLISELSLGCSQSGSGSFVGFLSPATTISKMLSPVSSSSLNASSNKTPPVTPRSSRQRSSGPLLPLPPTPRSSDAAAAGSASLLSLTASIPTERPPIRRPSDPLFKHTADELGDSLSMSATDDKCSTPSDSSTPMSRSRSCTETSCSATGLLPAVAVSGQTETNIIVDGSQFDAVASNSRHIKTRTDSNGFYSESFDDNNMDTDSGASKLPAQTAASKPRVLIPLLQLGNIGSRGDDICSTLSTATIVDSCIDVLDSRSETIRDNHAGNRELGVAFQSEANVQDLSGDASVVESCRPVAFTCCEDRLSDRFSEASIPCVSLSSSRDMDQYEDEDTPSPNAAAPASVTAASAASAAVPATKLTFSELKQRLQELRKLFLRSSRIYSSPLTRAVQTAVLGLRRHPAMRANGVTLLSTIREIKGVASLDSIGIACGEAISERVQNELESLIGCEAAKEVLKDANINHNDTLFPWWTNISSYDGKQEAISREQEFLNFVQYCGDEYPIFVGHSLFFKHFYSSRVSKQLCQARPNLAQELKLHKLANATVLAVTVQFPGPTDDPAALCGKDRRPQPMIVEAELIFGSGFHVSSSSGNSSHSKPFVSEADESGMSSSIGDHTTVGPLAGGYNSDDNLESSAPTSARHILTRHNSKSAVIGRAFSKGIEETRDFATKISEKLERINQGVSSSLTSMFGLGSKSFDAFDS